MKAIFYACIRRIFYYYHHFYFRKIEVVGLDALPKKGGILFSPNHQGAFLDPIIVGSIVKLPLSYLTRGDVFDGRLHWFLEALRALPVYRIRNGFSTLKNNATTFERCYELLSKGEHLMMFSEGLHHEEYFLHPLSKGSSRLMYTAQERHPGQPMFIVPVGINYENHRRPFGALHLVFGPAIPVQSFFDASKTAAQNINALKAALTEGMKATLWLPDGDKHYLAKKNYLYPSNTNFSFWELKRALHLWPTPLPAPKKRPIMLNSIIFLGYALHFLPFLVLKIILQLFSDVVFHNSLKYVFGLLILPLWWGTGAILASRFFDWKTALLLFLMQLFFLYSRQYLLLFKK